LLLSFQGELPENKMMEVVMKSRVQRIGETKQQQTMQPAVTGRNRWMFRSLGSAGLTFVLLFFLIQVSTAAFAGKMTREDADQAVDNVHTMTDTGVLTGPEEVQKIEKIWLQYYKDHPPRTFSSGVGQIYFDGEFPVNSFEPGTQGTFTFEFINTDTLQQQLGGPTIGSVPYEMSPHVGQPYVAIGSSTDAASNFALTIEMPQGEPSFEGIPFDTSGNPIVFTDFDGGNVAVGEYFNIPVPEPASLLLLGSGLLGTSGLLRKRIMRRG
jgi:hypothetical protein